MGIEERSLKLASLTREVLIDVKKKKISLETGHDGEQAIGQEEKQPEEIQVD